MSRILLSHNYELSYEVKATLQYLYKKGLDKSTCVTILVGNGVPSVFGDNHDLRYCPPENQGYSGFENLYASKQISVRKLFTLPQLGVQYFNFWLPRLAAALILAISSVLMPYTVYGIYSWVKSTSHVSRLERLILTSKTELDKNLLFLKKHNIGFSDAKILNKIIGSSEKSRQCIFDLLQLLAVEFDNGYFATEMSWQLLKGYR